MVQPIETAYVKLWGKTVGAVSWHPNGYAEFEFHPEFIRTGLDLAPLTMPIAKAQGRIFSAPQLSKVTYKGLPGLLADSLPDKFGNAIIDSWLAQQGRDIASFTPIERLCYTGARGMGALEYHPLLNDSIKTTVDVEIEQLVSLVQQIIAARKGFKTKLGNRGKAVEENALHEILRVGTSAGGARPKAVIAMNKNGHILSGQVDVPAGYEHWLLKFDGVTDIELGPSNGKGRVEYAYHKMAVTAGINMMECRLLEENNRAHFITKRFDRIHNDKLHMQTLCGLAHLDFNLVNSYEQAFQVMRMLNLTVREQEEMYRRMVFNVLARNHDDHTKNISFLMDKTGKWSLSPFYDGTFNYKPGGEWTAIHQMSVAGKRDGFDLPVDLLDVGKQMGIPRSKEIYEQVADAVTLWPTFAKDAGVDSAMVAMIKDVLRL